MTETESLYNNPEYNDLRKKFMKNRFFYSDDLSEDELEERFKEWLDLVSASMAYPKRRKAVEKAKDNGYTKYENDQMAENYFGIDHDGNLYSEQLIEPEEWQVLVNAIKDLRT